MAANSLGACCEPGGRALAESGPAAPAQAPVYCPVYEGRLLATARHELGSAALGVYGGPYAGAQGYGNYAAYGSEASAFYSLVRPPTPPAPVRGSRVPAAGWEGAGRAPRSSRVGDLGGGVQRVYCFPSNQSLARLERALGPPRRPAPFPPLLQPCIPLPLLTHSPLPTLRLCFPGHRTLPPSQFTLGTPCCS